MTARNKSDRMAKKSWPFGLVTVGKVMTTPTQHMDCILFFWSKWIAFFHQKKKHMDYITRLLLSYGCMGLVGWVLFFSLFSFFKSVSTLDQKSRFLPKKI